MSKYQKGTKVRVVARIRYTELMRLGVKDYQYPPATGTAKIVNYSVGRNGDNPYPYVVEFPGGGRWCYAEDELETL